MLSHGLNFCPPLKDVEREKLFIGFEVLKGQLFYHEPHSLEQVYALKARFSDLVHPFWVLPVNIDDFLNVKECIQTIKSLRSNNNIQTNKSNKGSGDIIFQQKRIQFQN